MYEFDSLCIYVFIHVKFIYDCNIWLYYQLTTVTDTYFRFLEENVVGMRAPTSNTAFSVRLFVSKLGQLSQNLKYHLNGVEVIVTVYV